MVRAGGGGHGRKPVIRRKPGGRGGGWYRAECGERPRSQLGNSGQSWWPRGARPCVGLRPAPAPRRQPPFTTQAPTWTHPRAPCLRCPLGWAEGLSEDSHLRCFLTLSSSLRHIDKLPSNETQTLGSLPAALTGAFVGLSTEPAVAPTANGFLVPITLPSGGRDSLQAERALAPPGAGGCCPARHSLGVPRHRLTWLYG